jgi:hypothetical protein
MADFERLNPQEADKLAGLFISLGWDIDFKEFVHFSSLKVFQTIKQHACYAESRWDDTRSISTVHPFFQYLDSDLKVNESPDGLGDPEPIVVIYIGIKAINHVHFA